MFLSTIIPGPSSPSWNIDVCLQPLIDELTQLWSSGALIYDISRKQNFVMRAALMWTINDFPAYGMVSSWSTNGKLACPYCMENNKAFTLTNRGKASFFSITIVSYHRITGTEITERIFLLAKLKRMLHPRDFLVKNYMMLYQSMVTLCLVSNQVSKSFLVLV
jgi:ABC-type iron transport system FetAB permease component